VNVAVVHLKLSVCGRTLVKSLHLFLCGEVTPEFIQAREVERGENMERVQ
jgi:hypothetical protein